MADKIQNNFYLLKESEKVLRKAKVIQEDIDFKFLHTLLKKNKFKEQKVLPNLSSKYEIKVYYKKAVNPVKWKGFMRTIVQKDEEIIKTDISISESYVILFYNITSKKYFASTGGYAHAVIQEIATNDFGLEILSRIIKAEDKVQLQKEDRSESLEQTFYINRGNNITLKEAYNLMEGRAVHKELTNKEGEKYNAWVQMDFKDADTKGNFALKHYHENYGFDLEAVLSKHPIKELANDSHKEDLVNSLKKGNLQSATFLKDGQEIKQYIEATPQYKTLTVYDANLKRLDTRQAKEQQQAQGEGQSSKQESKKHQSAGEEDGPGENQEKKQRRKKQSL